ncbi:hypothetical protein [Halomonas mongoliensis]|uniref:hypothetical protein n=1 Tax=Halomonas mongoliensis TaxID=321265 RepID=UPI00403AC32D
MTQNIFLFLCIALSFLVILVFTSRAKPIFLALLVAWVFRFALLFVDYYGLFQIPGSDSIAFTNYARHLVELPWPQMLALYDPTHAFNGYAWYGALVMRLVGFHELIMPAMNLLAGSIGLVFSVLIVQQMWGWKAAKIAAWIFALYPFAAFNSAIALREEFAITAFIVGLYYLLRWSRNDSYFGVFIAAAFFGIATSIHPGFVGAFVGMALFMGVRAFRSITVLVRGKGITVSELMNTLGSLVGLAALVGIITVGGGLSLGKGITVGGEDGDDAIVEAIESRFQRDARGGSAYPSFLVTGDPFAQPWLIPGRMVYFHFSPFPWDISSPRHLLGLVSAFLYAFLFYRIYKGWPQLRKRPEHEIMLFMLLGLTFVFAVGVTNIGTAIRHKTKFLVLVVVMAASAFSSLRVKVKVR